VSYLRAAGIKVGLITGRESTIVEKRSKELKLDFCYQGVRNKLEIFEKIKDEYGLMDEDIAYIGDDLNDLELIRKAGLGVTPSDSFEYIQRDSDMVSQSAGGKGVFRETADLILASQGKFGKILDI
jgi:3-deoxy-D-manno-octulosonate 8-phosphate phosphatase (KDO 8-P phosphatase)